MQRYTELCAELAAQMAVQLARRERRSNLTSIDLKEAKMQNTIVAEATLTNANLQRASAPQLQVHLFILLCICMCEPT